MKIDYVYVEDEPIDRLMGVEVFHMQASDPPTVVRLVRNKDGLIQVQWNGSWVSAEHKHICWRSYFRVAFALFTLRKVGANRTLSKHDAFWYRLLLDFARRVWILNR